MSEHTVIVCFDTKRFAEWSSQYGTWIPLEKYYHIDKDGRKIIRTRAAIAGYAFVPKKNTAEMLMDPNAARFGAHAYGFSARSGEPKTISTDELVWMQKLLNDEWSSKHNFNKGDIPTARFRSGDRVLCVTGPFNDREGIVENVKDNGQCRVLMGIHHVTMSPAFLLLV